MGWWARNSYSTRVRGKKDITDTFKTKEKWQKRLKLSIEDLKIRKPINSLHFPYYDGGRGQKDGNVVQQRSGIESVMEKEEKKKRERNDEMICQVQNSRQTAQLTHASLSRFPSSSMQQPAPPSARYKNKYQSADIINAADARSPPQSEMLARARVYLSVVLTIPPEKH